MPLEALHCLRASLKPSHKVISGCPWAHWINCLISQAQGPETELSKVGAKMSLISSQLTSWLMRSIALLRRGVLLRSLLDLRGMTSASAHGSSDGSSGHMTHGTAHGHAAGRGCHLLEERGLLSRGRGLRHHGLRWRSRCWQVLLGSRCRGGG